MNEQEGLLKRRESLNQNISKMAYEIWKIDNRLASLQQATKPNGFKHAMHRAKAHASLN
jgi:prefoldin subunit 5